ncbi:uracil-DNA glycosylase family protein [Alteromonas marina]|uniref:uracil-DNA glycosylase family protein n=1 Tax=unclassified Alteromonas TaxID=2614992 RepID=UPI00133071DC|nr:uracil-DNA glycosylase family protein [Alteromonas sp. KUL150]
MEKILKGHDELVAEALKCSLCAHALPHKPNPIFSTAPLTKILIIGQAPGLKAHESGVAFDDASGDRLRSWLSVSKAVFYNPKCISILPMGFCFPGYKHGADAPPRKECAPAWHHRFINYLQPSITIYVGRYAQQFYLPNHKTLTDAVKTTFTSPEQYFVLPHPSGRNNRWLAKNTWFETKSLPILQNEVFTALHS